MKKYIPLFFVIWFSTLFIVSCISPIEVHVTGVVVSPSEVSITVGGTVQLSCLIEPENAKNKDVLWLTSDSSIASVSDGIVKGLKSGNAVITVITMDGGYSAISSITVISSQTESPDDSDNSQQPETPEKLPLPDVISFSSNQSTANTFYIASGDYIYISSSVTYTTFYYTLDGTTPTTSSASLTMNNNYACSLEIKSSCTLKVFGYHTGYDNSDIQTVSITVLERLPAPTFTPSNGGLNSYDEEISISCSVEGASIFYTTDDTVPTDSCTLYTAPITITEKTTIRAIAVKAGYIDSYQGVVMCRDVTPPASVGNLEAINIDSTSIKLTWENPIDRDFVGCVIEYDGKSISTTKTQTAIIINGLEEFREYSFSIKTKDKAENVNFGQFISVTALQPARENIKGNAKYPRVGCIIPSLILHEDFVTRYNGQIYFNCWGYCNVECKYQWYKSFDNINWNPIGEEKNLSNVSEFGLGACLEMVSKGTVYYCMAVINDDTTVFSNVMKIQCGLSNSANIGKIYYSDGTLSDSYESNKTPVGIVCNVYDDGTVKNILSLQESSGEKAWYTGRASDTAYTATNLFSINDGLANTLSIYNSENFSESNYPSSYYAKTLDASRIWFIPSLQELAETLENRYTIENTINLLNDNGIFVPSIFSDNGSRDKTYWTSSSWGNGHGYLNILKTSKSFLSYVLNQPARIAYVRAVSRIQ